MPIIHQEFFHPVHIISAGRVQSTAFVLHKSFSLYFAVNHQMFQVNFRKVSLHRFHKLLLKMQDACFHTQLWMSPSIFYGGQSTCTFSWVSVESKGSEDDSKQWLWAFRCWGVNIDTWLKALHHPPDALDKGNPHFTKNMIMLQYLDLLSLKATLANLLALVFHYIHVIG